MSQRPDIITTKKVVNPKGPLEEQAGFYCSTCKALFNSYNALLDHTMSRVHLRNLGERNTDGDVDGSKPVPARTAAAMDRIAEASVTVEAVRARLEVLRKKRQIQSRLAQMDPQDRLKARLQAAEQAEALSRQQKRAAKKEAARRRKQSED